MTAIGGSASLGRGLAPVVAAACLWFSAAAHGEEPDRKLEETEIGNERSSGAAATESEKQLRFELRQLQLMNERQRRLILEMEQRLERYGGAGAEQRRSVAGGEAAVGTEKKAEKTREAQRSLEDFLQEQHTVFTRRLTIEPSLTYTASDRKQIDLSGFLAVDAIFLGRLNVDEVDNRILTFDVTGRYTVTDNVQLFLRLPYIYRRSEFASAGVDFSTASSSDVTLDNEGMGDVEFGAAFRVRRETARVPDIVLNLRGRAPTGSDPFGIKTITPDPNNSNLRVPERLATGTGVWAASLGVSLVKTLDPAILFGGVEYMYQFEEELDDVSTTPGVKRAGEVRLGDAVQFNMGTAFALNEIMSLSFSFTNRLLDDSKIRTGREWVEIPGSSANVATFNVGATFAISDRYSFAANLASGLTREASDFSLSLRLPMVL